MSHAGWTKGPCPGCGEGEQHPSRGVCQECRGLLRDGNAYRQETTRRLAAEGTPSVWQWTERAYAWPRYYGDYEFERDDAKDTLNAAMFAVVEATSEPAPPGTPRQSAVKNPDKHSYKPFLDWPTVFSTAKGEWSFERWILMPGPVRAALDALDAAIRGALHSAYTRGKRDGASLLHQLAIGEITTDEFDDALLTRDERRARDRR